MATYLQDDDDHAIIRLQQGATDQIIRIPKNIMPTEIKPCQNFSLTIQPKESAEKEQYDTLKKLLRELIN